jgi:hypothetical protein
MRNASVVLRNIRNKMEEVYATDNQEYINNTLPDLIALWMITVEEAYNIPDDEDSGLAVDNQQDDFKRDDFEYMLKLLDISIAHLEQSEPDTIYTPHYVGPERRRHPLVETVVNNLHPRKGRGRGGTKPHP